MNKIKLIAALAVSLVFTSSSIAGVVLGGTRVIYWSDKNDATMTLTNTRNDISYLVQSWVSGDGKNTKKTPFIITPPIFKLGPGKKNILRIVNVDDNLPDDRESLFWVNIKPIPGSEHESDNELQVIIKSSLKLFYRPSSLKDIAGIAYKKLTFTQEENGIDVFNPTPVYINLYNLLIDGKPQDDISLIPPMTHVFIKKNKHVSGIVWQAINDSGSVNDSMTYQF